MFAHALLVAALLAQSGWRHHPAPQPEFDVLCSAGRVANWECIHKFGLNEDIDTAAAETIWTNGGTYTFAAAAQTLGVVSSDANDDGSPTGTGAHTVKIYGLDASFMSVDETVTLNGITEVTTSQSFLRVWRAQVMSAGSTGSNEGTITIDQTTSGTVMAGITPGNNQTQLGVYTVPDGYTCYLRSIQGSATRAASTAAQVQLFARREGEVFQLKGTYGFDTASNDTRLETPQVLPEHTDIYFQGTVVANNTEVAVQWSMACWTGG